MCNARTEKAIFFSPICYINGIAVNQVSVNDGTFAPYLPRIIPHEFGMHTLSERHCMHYIIWLIWAPHKRCWIGANRIACNGEGMKQVLHLSCQIDYLCFLRIVACHFPIPSSIASACFLSQTNRIVNLTLSRWTMPTSIIKIINVIKCGNVIHTFLCASI